MQREGYMVATWLMWVALPATALNYWLNWDRMPARVATHFDASGHPNGWTTRQGAFEFALLFTVFFLAVFTVAAYAVRARKPDSAWPVLAISYVVMMALWGVSNWLVWRNLPG
jgi:uncharacterized membrane protein